METITDISEKGDRSGRYIVTVDGRDLGLVSLERLADLGLRIGDTLDVKAGDQLRDAIAAQAVFDKAVELLGVRQRSSRELQRRLLQKGAGKAHVDAAMERLVALGYLNDAALAESVVRSRLVEGGSSKRRVQQDLIKRGVDRSVADDAIQRAIEEHDTDEGAAALELARKRLRSMQNLAPDVKRRRLYGFLARRGYDPDAIATVIRALGPALAGRDQDDALDSAEQRDE